MARKEKGSAGSAECGVVEHFRDFADEYDTSAEWCDDADLLQELIGDTAAERILDLGCGTGLVANALRRRHANIWGADLSLAMLVKARARIGSRVVLSQAERLPLRPESFDRVVCRQLLHYTEEAGVLCEAARILRPGGLLRLAQVTSFDERDLPFWSAFKAVTQPLRRRFHSPESLRLLLESTCFRVVESHRYRMRRHYNHADMLRRSPLPPGGEQEQFANWVRQKLEELAQVLEPIWTEQGVSFLQSWTLLAAVRM